VNWPRLAGQVLGPGQRPQRRRPQQRGDGRVGAEEARGRRPDHAVDDEIVQRYVMAAEAPAPRRRAARLAEHPQVIQARIAAAFPAPVDGPALDLVQHVVQPDDGGDGDVSRDGEPAGDELVSQALLGRALRAERQAAVVGRGVEPAPALGVRPGVRTGRGTGGQRTLTGVERIEPGHRGGGHPRRRLPARVGFGHVHEPPRGEF
jgi:hypothetical protein